MNRSVCFGVNFMDYVFRIEAYENIFTVLTFHGYNGRRAPTIPEAKERALTYSK